MNRNLAATFTVAAALTLPFFAGCTQPEDARPDPAAFHRGESGLQSKDLIEMTDRLSADLLQIPEIAQNPNKIVIVMTSIDNHMESQPGRDMTIYLARMRTKLNTNARDRLVFIEPRKTLQRLQAQEGPTGGDPFGEASRGYNPNPGPGQIQAQYALKGEFYEKADNRSHFFLCTFQLTRIGNAANAGELVWDRSYEVKTVD